ncbi:MAG: response regulator [Archangium sp.]|nr:response regulator [Archangium sp.]MDP3575070.1 response regulator [Archangium sp.]
MNILIVDDDRSVQRVLADALTRQGFVVTVERDGEWAIKSFEKKNFDAVLLDLLLPALSGYEVAKQIRALPRGRRVPIIMISGVYKNPVHQREAVDKHGAFALLEKPLDLKLLTGTLRDALGDRYPSPSPPQPPPPPMEEDEKTGEYMADDSAREEAEDVERDMPAVTPPRPKAPPAKPKEAPRAPREAPRPAPKEVKKKEAPRPPPPPVEEEVETKSEVAWARIQDKSFAQILADAYRTRFGGAVRLRRGNVKKIVYFREGTPELVKSNLLVECLGRVLVKEKMISEAECEESLRRMKASKRMQGTVLIEMGCISPHNLQHSLVLQLQHKVWDAFSWDDGEYQFIADAPLPAEPLSIGMTCAQLIHEGVKRTYDEKRLFKAFSGLDLQYVHPSDDPLYALQDVGLGPEEQELLKLADGHKTLTTLRALEVLPPFETDRFFFSMKCAQMVSFKAQHADGKPKVSYAEIAASANAMPAKKSSLPPPLPSMPPPLPPPLPANKKPAAHPAEPPLELPWSDAKLAQPMARLDVPPPPPPDASPQRPAKKAEPQVLAKSAGSLLPELSEVVSLPRLSGQEGAQREKLAAKFTAMRRLDYFELLGVKWSATREDVKRAYFALAKEYHPDKHFSSASAETRALAQQIYDLISTAHDTLTDADDRKRYIAQLEEGAKQPDDADVGKILAAEGKFQRGEELMRLRQYGDANRLFREAITLYPEEGEFHAWEGWALFQADPTRADDAVRSIEQAVNLNPKIDKGYLFLGYIHKATGRPDRAERQFEKAIQCNPDCTEALRELRLLGKQRR